MKILKRIFAVIAIIIALVLIVALFVKKDYSVEREITINKPKDEVFNYIKYLKNQNNYSKWAKMDADLKQEFRGTDATVGFVSAWEGEKSGKGEQEIVKIDDGRRIDYELRFIKPIKSKAPAYMTTEAEGASQTKVKWGFQGNMPYPWNIMRLFMNMEKMIGDDLQTGLNNLKVVLEK